MRRIKAKTLHLSTETLRLLKTADLSGVNGGQTGIRYTQCNTCPISCVTNCTDCETCPTAQ